MSYTGYGYNVSINGNILSNKFFNTFNDALAYARSNNFKSFVIAYYYDLGSDLLTMKRYKYNK